MIKSNRAYEMDTTIDTSRTPGLKKLRRTNSKKRIGVCPNCKCERYTPCTCTRKLEKGDKE